MLYFVHKPSRNNNGKNKPEWSLTINLEIHLNASGNFFALLLSTTRKNIELTPKIKSEKKNKII
jgi:hypothetical protein